MTQSQNDRRKNALEYWKSRMNGLPKVKNGAEAKELSGEDLKKYKDYVQGQIAALEKKIR